MNQQAPPPLRVAVLGLGYVGCVTAACLAELGHRVTGVDPDARKVESVLEGKAPFWEPGLEEIVSRNRTAGRLAATAKTADALADADIACVCVGTPSAPSGDLGLDQLTRTSREIAACLEGRSKPLIVAIRSTVFPGTCEEVFLPALAGKPAVSLVANPEFLREGCAVEDFMEPSLIVVGSDDADARACVAGLYARLAVAPCLVALRTAEMIKYACNAFHAVKIDFANEIAAVCRRLGIPAGEVMRTLCHDSQFNLSAAYLKPGFAFGGSCLPKDLRALTYRTAQLRLPLPLLESVLPSNRRHLERCVQAALDLPAEKIGVFGLAFKENTDDVRESPVLALIERLLANGRDVRVFDPHVQLGQVYGANRTFLIAALPQARNLMADTLEDLLQWAHHVVIAQKPSPDFAARLLAAGKPLLDLAGVFGDPASIA